MPAFHPHPKHEVNFGLASKAKNSIPKQWLPVSFRYYFTRYEQDLDLLGFSYSMQRPEQR